MVKSIVYTLRLFILGGSQMDNILKQAEWLTYFKQGVINGVVFIQRKKIL